MTKYVYRFSGDIYPTNEERTSALLGGKGAHICDMVRMGLPVPPGFVISVQACLNYQEAEDPVDFMDQFMASNDMKATINWLGIGTDRLVSVRSGAPMSMPGMMDTILNVGLHSHNINDWIDRMSAKTVWDCRRRLLEMFGDVVFGRKEVFDEARAKRVGDGVPVEGFGSHGLKMLAMDYEKCFGSNLMPNRTVSQLRMAIEAIFKSWNNQRAIDYRNVNGIAHDIGTAVVIQAMVYGNANDNSGSGVMFTRNPSSGENEMIGEFLLEAQGEDVVAGIRIPEPLSYFMTEMVDAGKELTALAGQLEQYYLYPQDVEFTVESGKLWLLQTRDMKRTSMAAFRVAHDMVSDCEVTKDEAVAKLEPEDFFLVRGLMVDPTFTLKGDATGLPACPGVGIGEVVFTAKRAIKWTEEGRSVILVTKETVPDDFMGMMAAKAFVTAKGGVTCHAAIIARAMNKPCVVGVPTLEFPNDDNIFEAGLILSNGDKVMVIKEGDMISVDGTSGNVWLMEIPTVNMANLETVKTVSGWLFDEPGLWRITNRYDGLKAVIVTAEWGFREVETRVKELVETIKELGAEGVILDMTPPMELFEKKDMKIWDIFGDHTDLAKARDALITALEGAQSDLTGLRVLQWPKGVPLPDGVEALAPVKTVAEIMAGGDLIITSKFVKGILGGQDILDKLEALADNPITTFRSMTLLQRVLEVVG